MIFVLSEFDGRGGMDQFSVTGFVATTVDGLRILGTIHIFQVKSCRSERRMGKYKISSGSHDS